MPDSTDISARYCGSRHLSEDVRTALQLLTQRLSLTHFVCGSHSVLLVENLQDDDCLEATAVYLVSAIAQSIEANLTLREALFDEEQFERELLADVVAVIRRDNTDDIFRAMVRDPWIWEGMSHMLIHLSRDVPGFHPSGTVLAKTSIKYDVHDHGLDMISIYRANTLGISAGECKAYLQDPGRAITDASLILSEVDSNKRDIEIRAIVNQLRSSLHSTVRAELAGSFWRDERSYLPFVCCDEAHASDWTRNRKSLRKLALPVSKKFLIPVTVPRARDAFDRICDLMRSYAAMTGG